MKYSYSVIYGFDWVLVCHVVSIIQICTICRLRAFNPFTCCTCCFYFFRKYFNRYEDISDESFDQMRARITAGGRFLDSPVNKKPLIERKQDLQLEKMLLLRNQWLREVEDSIMKDGNHAFDLLRSHAVD